jgi:choline transport protein
MSYHRAGWHATLLLWAVLLLCVFINVFVSGALPTIEVVVLIVHVLGFFGILVPLVYLSGTYNSAKVIFTTFNNTGKWSTTALAFFVGLQGNALAFVGTDSVVHVSILPAAYHPAHRYRCQKKLRMRALMCPVQCF